MECLTYCLAARVDLTRLEQAMRHKTSLTIEKNWRVVGLIDKAKNSYCYIFDNGTLVFWNLKRYQIKPYLEWAYSFCAGRLSRPLVECFSCRLNGKTFIKPHDYFNVDCLILESDDQDLKLSLSYGFSQSIKLKSYEDSLESLISRYNPLFQDLSQHGHLKLTRQKLRKIIGDILVAKSELSLTSNFLYHPKFFWQHPNLEFYFTMIARYLDISKRAEILIEQLNTLNEIFFMCNSYLENKHSHSLEIIIIVLIMIEIIFSFIGLHL